MGDQVSLRRRLGEPVECGSGLFGLCESCVADPLHEQCGVAGRLTHRVDRLLRHRCCERRQARQLLGELDGALERLSRRGDLRDEPEAVRFVRVDAVTKQGELLRPSGSEEAHEAMRAARAREDAERHLREAEDGRLVCDAEVGGQRELEGGAEAVAVDRDERGDGERREELVDRSRPPVVGHDRAGVAVGELGDVGARGERSALASQHERPAVACCPFELRRERSLHVGGDRVQLLGAVEPEDADVVHAVDVDEAPHATHPVPSTRRPQLRADALDVGA